MEILNNLKFPGTLDNMLELKNDISVMLLRNIIQRKRLCNDTRLLVTLLEERVIKAKILKGTHVGDKVLIPHSDKLLQT